jgi:hypothetical protein
VDLGELGEEIQENICRKIRLDLVTKKMQG